MIFPHFRSQVLLAVSICLLIAVCPVTAQSDEKTQEAINLFNQGQDAHEKGDLKTALVNYERALELLPEFPEAALQRGNVLVSLGRTEDAEKAFRKALASRPDWTLAMASLGGVLVQQKSFKEAEALLTSALEGEGSNQAALSSLADLYLRTDATRSTLSGHLARVSALASKMRPTNDLLIAKAAIELRLNDTDAAKATVGRVLQIEPKNIAANVIAADIALMQRDPSTAENHARSAEAAGADMDVVRRIRGSALLLRGRKAEALSELESIVAPPESVKALIAEIKEPETADLAGLEAKVQRKPDDAGILSKLCQGFRIVDPAKAAEYCRRASELEPNEIAHAIGFGAALVQAKRYEDAITLFRKLLTVNPENATIRANLATALFQLKRYAEAKPEFRWLTEKQPESPAAFYFLGIVHDQLGEYLDAMANYQRFLRLADPERDKTDIERVNLRMPAVQKLAKNRKG